jgi:hypothetical protein
MPRDPIVEEVRAHRAAIAQEHGNDLKAILAAFRRREGTDGRHVISFAARRVPKKPARRRAG